MNERLKETLDQYEDFELAFLYRYKIETYTKGTRDSVVSYIRDRRLTDAKIDALVSELEFSKCDDRKIRCTRCTSTKLRIQDVAWDNPSYSSWETMDALFMKRAALKEQIECTVCGNWVKDPNNQGPPKSFLERLKGRYKK